LLDIVIPSTIPAHLVVTKWDVLRDPAAPDDNEQLGRIRDRLLEHPGFRERARCGPVRLIPVSAIGPGLATIDEDGLVGKRPGIVARPLNVEIPICTVVPDLLARAEREIVVEMRGQAPRNRA
jgi:hypothetical protein